MYESAIPIYELNLHCSTYRSDSSVWNKWHVLLNNLTNTNWRQTINQKLGRSDAVGMLIRSRLECGGSVAKISYRPRNNVEACSSEKWCFWTQICVSEGDPRSRAWPSINGHAWLDAVAQARLSKLVTPGSNFPLVTKYNNPPKVIFAHSTTRFRLGNVYDYL